MKRNRKNGRPLENDRPVRIIELGLTFPNYISAAEFVGGDRTCVYSCLKGMRKTHKGYTFMYERPKYEEEEGDT